MSMPTAVLPSPGDAANCVVRPVRSCCCWIDPSINDPT
jgi:hypothetical protein